MARIYLKTLIWGSPRVDSRQLILLWFYFTVTSSQVDDAKLLITIIFVYQNVFAELDWRNSKKAKWIQFLLFWSSGMHWKVCVGRLDIKWINTQQLPGGFSWCWKIPRYPSRKKTAKDFSSNLLLIPFLVVHLWLHIYICRCWCGIKRKRKNSLIQVKLRIVIWLILPVVICLSQRLSHACLSISNLYSETANGSLNQLSFIW